MTRRVIAALVAVVLALVGGVLLFNYVNTADARAMAGQQPVAVLVVMAPVPRGTAAQDLGSLVAVKQLPQAAKAADAVASVADIMGKVASTALLPGEQVLSTRFVDPSADEITSAIEVPKDKELIGLQLSPDRALGAHVKPGDRVGVFVSVKFEDGEEPERTFQLASKVLVTRVQGAVVASTAAPAPSASPGAPAGEKAPTSTVLLTLAVSPAEAQRLVFSLEYGKVWLTLQRAGFPDTDLPVTTSGNLFSR